MNPDTMNPDTMNPDTNAVDNALADGEEGERNAIAHWLKNVRPSDLHLGFDSTPMTVLFAVRTAIEAGVHNEAPAQAKLLLAELLGPRPRERRNEADHINSVRLDHDDLEVWIAARPLIKAGITTIGDVALRTDRELLSVPGFGRRRLNELKAALERIGVEVGDLLPGDNPQQPGSEPH